MKNSILRIAVILSIGLVSDGYSLPEFRNIRQNSDSVGRYDKLEIFINVDAEFVNPFDPEEIDIRAKITSPSGKVWDIPGFYMNSFFSIWRVRFSPDEIGNWKYVITVEDKNGPATSESQTFVTIESSYKGPIQISANKRYLEYRNGTPYYGIGLWQGRPQAESLDDLKDLGVNFISKLIRPLETWGTGLGRYDQDYCRELDELLGMLEEREMLLSLNFWFHSFLSETTWGEGWDRQWGTHPYQLVTPAKDFYRSEAAWAYQEKLYRYMIARWGYSRSLGIWFVVDEVNGTDGWASGDSLAAADWGRKVHDFFKQNDPYGHLTTGTRSGGIKEFWHEGYQIFDLAAREIYEAQGFPITKTGKEDPSATHPLTYSYSNYAQEIQKLWNGYEKPAIVGETGWDHTFYETSMPGYFALYHNALWVTLATGTAMTPFWWSYSGRLNDLLLTAQITNIKEFADEIPFSTLTNLSQASVSVSNGDGYAIKSDEMIFGWFANPQTDVGGETVTINSLPKGNYKLRVYHTWRGEFIHEEEIKTSKTSASFVVPTLQMGGSHANYIGEDIAFILEPID